MFKGIIVYDSCVKLKDKFVSVRTVTVYRAGGGKLVFVQIPNIGTNGGVWSASHSGRFTPRKTPDTHYTGGWVGTRASMYDFGEVKISFSSLE
jgi:hypothetical protein